MMLIRVDPHLHTPMCFFPYWLILCKPLLFFCLRSENHFNFLSQNKSISYHGCAMQVYFFCTLADTESFILAAMEYDLYVATYNPLLYMAVMSWGIWIWLIILSYFGGSMSSLVHTSFAFILKYCDKNIINHFFFCDLPPLLKLSCTDKSLNEWLLSKYGSSV